MTSSSTTIAAVSAAETSITAIHSDVIQSHILNRLDGPTLASTSCASAQLLSLCNDDHLWRNITNATWPSTADPRVGDAISAFPSCHRSFYSDAFPSALLRRRTESDHPRPPPAADTSELISAVDIYYDEELIYSKVLVTETASAWFLNTPLRLDLLDHKETLTTPPSKLDGGAFGARVEERLRVSWVVIDPVRRRAVNVASRAAVDARRHWLTAEDTHLRYAIVSAAEDGGGDLVQCGVVVTCGGGEEEGQVRVREVSMQVEDAEGKTLSGMDSLVILQDAMDAPRSRSSSKMERDGYEMFLKTKEWCRERKERREKGLDMVCMTAGVSIFIAVILMFFLWR